MREKRQQDIEDHVKQVNELIKEARLAGQDGGAGSGEEDGDGDEWPGFEDDVPLEPVDREDEYIDEDRYTTVTVESVTVDRDGMHRPEESSEEDEEGDGKTSGHGAPGRTEDAPPEDQKKEHPKKRKKVKFRYENKLERQLTQRKQKASNKRPR